MKLDAKVMTVASASVLFHRFFREVNTTDYDIYVSGGLWAGDVIFVTEGQTTVST